MTTERHDFIDPSRVDNSLVRRRLARMTKAELVDAGVDNFERVVDLLNDNDQLRRERNGEALGRQQAEGELDIARETIADLEHRATYLRGLLRTVSQSMGSLLRNAYHQGWYDHALRIAEARERRAYQFQPGILTFAQRSASFVGRVLDRLSNIEHVVIGRISLGGEGVLPYEEQEKPIDPNFR